MSKIDQHELIRLLIDIAVELGYTPTRDEFIKKVRNGKALIDLYYGSYSTMIHAAGLESPRAPKNKYEVSPFYKPITEAVLEHVPVKTIENPVYKNTLIIGDTHFPFIHEPTLEKLYEFARKHEVERIVQVGDLYDQYAHSKFPRSLNVYSPLEEETLAIEGATKMWQTLQQICPKAECVQLLGNHDIRAAKRTLELNPAMEHVVAKHLKQIMTFQNVTTIHDPRQEYIVDGIAFLHGYRSKLGDHRDYMLMNAVCGHIHRGGVSFRRFQNQTFWELNAGFLGDPNAKALSYNSQKLSDYTLGFGWLDQYGARFIHC
jgi:predicted phosphodiesterase